MLHITFSKYDCIIVYKAYYLFTCRGDWGKLKRKILSVSQGVNNVNMVILRYSAYFRG